MEVGGETEEPSLVDCHVHLDDQAFQPDLEEVLHCAQQAGVRTLIAVSENRESAEAVLSLAQRYPALIRPCIGLHPTPRGGTVTREQMEEVRRLVDDAHRECLVGIGECGLDFQPRSVPTDEHKLTQRWVFEQQIRLAREYDLPLSVHSRSAGRPVIEWLQVHGAQRVCLHAFDGSVKVAKRAIAAGYFFSVPPSVCRSPSFQELVKAVPMEQLLLESDAPALSPAKGERNVPSNVTISCHETARIKNMSIQEVAKITTRNAHILFGMGRE
jgi:TatD DNase family protein